MNNEKNLYTSDTIVALATATGVGAIAVIRLSGKEAIEIADKIFKTTNGKLLSDVPSHTVHLGTLMSGKQVVDECLATIFKGNKSYTGEPVVEFSCHGSTYIIQEVIKLCLANGARLAQAGEFTKRAFLNGKLALNQAEAVADLIASDSAASHQVALQQMRGGFTFEIETLRQELLNFASLIELELDFSEEDVAFADRKQLEQLLQKIKTTLTGLIQSFSAGNAIKNGIPVAIVGKPNAGKSTLLNVLLNEERAIVSDIAGTTRDTIEETLHIGGVTFRFIDTAGIRDTKDTIEAIGVEKAKEKMKKAQIILYLYNREENTTDEIKQFIKENYREGVRIILLCNKAENYINSGVSSFEMELLELPDKFIDRIINISARYKKNLSELEKALSQYAKNITTTSGNTIVTNIRHYEALQNALNAVEKVEEGMANHLTGDLLAIDIRETLYHLGSITGAVSNDEVLGNIFSKFCIGK
ncbi:MAG: tRNA uridine-5-carboxymethylaminomethyl(34) synthesis GTPase MnmE [Capnocytophaga sp.]|nr:tRNA uridine-5-carboxymethylaminomethyl(34) synthesis GTPase MnmE [Capnocytophaga sp.]